MWSNIRVSAETLRFSNVLNMLKVLNMLVPV
jgi:hypothetical protein